MSNDKSAVKIKSSQRVFSQRQFLNPKTIRKIIAQKIFMFELNKHKDRKQKFFFKFSQDAWTQFFIVSWLTFITVMAVKQKLSFGF